MRIAIQSWWHQYIDQSIRVKAFRLPVKHKNVHKNIFNTHTCSLTSFDFVLEKTTTDKNPKQNLATDKNMIDTVIILFWCDSMFTKQLTDQKDI